MTASPRKRNGLNLITPALALTVLLLAGCARGTKWDTLLTSQGHTRDQIRAHRILRRALAQKPRRIMFNNDGCDAAYFPENSEITPENLLALRTTPLTKTQVDTLCYCTISSGFGLFTHNTAVGEILDHDLIKTDNRRNITTELIAQGTDTLKVMVDFCHANDLECFWSMRMNDTHDGAHRPEKPYPLFPKLKEDHPEWLNGSIENRPRHGSWTSVNYAKPEIRELAFRYIEEVCLNYPVDGIELDFFRHLSYLKSVAFGEHAPQREIHAITQLIRRVRTMTESVGLRRGKPILVAVRVPDCPVYAKRVGLDIEQWMNDDLADIFIGSGYFRLRPWTDWVALCHKYGVQCFAGLSESRVRGEDKRFSRASAESYRGRAAAAWTAGVDGIYIFNVYNAKATFLSEVGRPESLEKLKKLYFPTVRDGNPESYLANGTDFKKLPLLTPHKPWEISSASQNVLPIVIGDPMPDSPAGTNSPNVTCHLRVEHLDDVENLDARWNGIALPNGSAQDQWLDIPIPPSAVKLGTNRLSLKLKQDITPDSQNPDEWTVEYRGNRKLAPPRQLPWRRAFPACDYVEEVRNGALLLADRATGKTEYPHLMYPWRIHPDDETVVEARVKVLSSDNPLGVCIRIANGRAVEYLTLQPNKIRLHFAGIEVPFDTTDAFHTYTIRCKQNTITVAVDGDLALDGAGAFKTPADDKTRWLDLLYGLQNWNRRHLYFGSASGPGKGEALWEVVRFRTQTRFALLKDAVVTVAPK